MSHTLVSTHVSLLMCIHTCTYIHIHTVLEQNPISYAFNTLKESEKCLKKVKIQKDGGIHDVYEWAWIYT